MNAIQFPTVALEASVVLVTPEMAKEWLSRNHPDNRPISHTRVANIVSDILSGQWRLTHQAVCFDAERRLIDGQHRLEAVVRSGLSVPMLVVTNPLARFDDPIDSGGKRTTAFIARIPAQMVAAYRVVEILELNDVRHTLTPSAALSAAERNRPYVEAFCEIAQGSRLLSAVVGACLFTMPIDQERTLRFAQQVAKGEMIAQGDPAFALRAWLANRHPPDLWSIAMATLGALAAAVVHQRPHRRVFTGTDGYNVICMRRRAMKIPRTPTPQEAGR